MKKNRMNQASMITLLLACSVCFTFGTDILTGQTVKEGRNLPTFKSIQLTMSADIYLSQGDPQMVQVEAEKAALEFIETEVSGNSLVVKTRNGHWRGLDKVKVFITVPEISQISLSGSGNLVSQTPIRSGDMKIEVSGSGSLKIAEIEAPAISVTITGSGNVTLAGKNDQADLKATITGSGSFKADELNVATAGITITGSGSARVNVLKEMETNITGSGNVLYKGSPLINARSTGSGKTNRL